MQLLILIDTRGAAFQRDDMSGIEAELGRLFSSLANKLRNGDNIERWDGKWLRDSGGGKCGTVWCFREWTEDEQLSLLRELGLD